MAVENLVKNIANNISKGNLVMAAVIPIVGVTVGCGVKKLVGNKKQKNSKMKEDSESCSTLKSVFGTDDIPNEDEPTVNFIFGTTTEIENEKEKRGHFRNEVIYTSENKIEDEFCGNEM